MTNFLENEDASIRLKNLVLLESKRTRLQRIALYRHETLGHVLTINGELQHVEGWQALYHEPLVHVPTSFIRTVKSALVLGGGDLFAAREILKYPSVLSVTLVEHDRNVLEIVRRHYKHADSVLSDNRLKIVIADARQEFSGKGPKYDLIINDCFDLSAPTTHRNSYRKLAQRLTSEGVCSDMIYRHVFHKKVVRQSLVSLSKHARVVLGLMTIPEYPGALHLLTLWGRNKHLLQKTKRIRNEAQQQALARTGHISFDYYNPRFRDFFLYIPPYVQRVIHNYRK